MAKRARVKTVVNEHVFLDRFLMKQLCVRQNLRDSKAVLGYQGNSLTTFLRYKNWL